MTQALPAPFETGFRLINGSLLNDVLANPTVSAQNNIVAHAGGGQTLATALTSRFNSVATVATANDSVKLPTANAGVGPITVYNGTANNLAVWPSGTDTIGSLTSPTIVLGGTTTMFSAVPGNNWTTIGSFTFPLETATSVTAVAGTTLSAAALAGGIIIRTGPSANFTDTTDTAANIIAAIPNAYVGQYLGLFIINNSNFNETLTGGVGVTFSGPVIVPANSESFYYIQVTGASTVTILNIVIGSLNNLPQSQFSTGTTTTTFTAGQLTGANNVFYTNTGATPGSIATRTAAQMVADIPNAYIGLSWTLTIVNGQGTGTLTVTGGTNVTVTGTATIAANTTRTFVCTITAIGTPAITMQNVGTGTFS